MHDSESNVVKARIKQWNEKYVKYLLISCPNDKHVAASELPQAFINGYIAALHKTRTYNRIFAIREQNEHIAEIKHALDHLPSPLAKAFGFYLYPNSNTVPIGMLRKSFIEGYIAAIHVAATYDDVLYATSERDAISVITKGLVDMEENWEECQLYISDDANNEERDSKVDAPSQDNSD